MTLATHEISATVFASTPAYDYIHPEEIVYSANFDTGGQTMTSEGWVPSFYSQDIGSFYGFARSYPNHAHIYILNDSPPTPPVTGTFTRTVTGLVIGRDYTFSAWAKVANTAEVGYTDQARVGILTIGYASYITLSNAWQLLTYTFTATATSHVLVITGYETDPSATTSEFFLDDVSLVKDEWSEHFEENLDYTLDLNVTKATIELDDSWVPYVQATLTCFTPPPAELEGIDPRLAPRVVLTATRTEEGEADDERVFDLQLRALTVDHNAGTMELRLASDEAKLLDYARVATTSDDTIVEEQASLRTLIDTRILDLFDASLETDAGADADLTIFADSVNLIPNPSAETNTAAWTGTAITLTRATGVVTGVVGAAFFRMQTPSSGSGTCFMESTTITVTPGETYVFSGNWMVSGTPSGSVHASARRMTIVDGAVTTTLASSTQASSSGERVYGEVTIPAGITTIRVRAWHGYGTSGDIRWDALKFAIKTGSLSDHDYFDGATTDTAEYSYAWDGTANNSTSTRTNLTGKELDAETFAWTPGVTAWDFIEPLLDASGLWLYCDEARLWHLVDEDHSVAGTVELASGDNLMIASDTIDREGDWHDSVVIRYRWLNKWAVEQTRYDIAGAPGTKTKYIEYNNRAFPGAGAAASVLARAVTKGRTLELEAGSRYTTTPRQDVEASLPETATQVGRVSSVKFAFPEGVMRVGTAGLVDLP